VVVVVIIFIMKEKIVKSEDAEAMCHFVVLCFFSLNLSNEIQ